MNASNLLLFPTIGTIAYLVLLGVALAFSYMIMRKGEKNPFSYIATVALYSAVALLAVRPLSIDGFAVLCHLCWACFVGGLILLVMSAWLSRKRFKIICGLFTLLAIVDAGVGIDAFLIEPNWLETRHVYLTSSKLKKPLTISVLSDLQTDHVGDFQKNALRKLLEANPDIILLPGDYIQQWYPQRTQEVAALHDFLRDSHFTAPNGVYAVRGNVEDGNWPAIFDKLPVRIFEKTEPVVARDDVVVWGLNFDDSFNDKLKIPADKEKYSIAVGHGPDFALGEVQTDLMVAGHTHGGQVQLPGYGPPITLCRVPRDWAAGGTFEVRPGRTLMLTKGAGMERFFAPRLRFFCHPEIVIIHVSPVSAAQGATQK